MYQSKQGVFTQKRATLTVLWITDYRRAGKKQGEWGQGPGLGARAGAAVALAGGADQVGGEQWSDSGFILEAESIGFPDGLDVRYERERHRGTPKVSA